MTQTNANKWSDEISFDDIVEIGDVTDRNPPGWDTVGTSNDDAPVMVETANGSQPMIPGDRDRLDTVMRHGGFAPEPTTIPVIMVSPSVEAPVIVETAAALVQTEREVLRAHGIAESEQLFEDGTAFLAIGHDTLEDDMAQIRALPPFSTGVEDLKAMIASECRRDLVGDLRKLRLNNDGLLAPMGNPDDFAPLAIEENAWRQLAAKVGSQNLNLGLARRATAAPMRIRTRNKL